MKLKIDKIGKVTSEAVLKCTSKDWAEWMTLLNKAGVKTWPRKEIVALLKQKYKLSPWWQQEVTRGFEIHSGLRVKGQSLKGTYSTVVTRNFPLLQKNLWKFLISERGIKIWLDPLSEIEIEAGGAYEVYGGIFGVLKSVKAPQKIRMTWQEVEWTKPSIVQLLLVPRPLKKCMLVIQHENLKTETLKIAMHKKWKLAINELYEKCASGDS